VWNQLKIFSKFLYSLFMPMKAEQTLLSRTPQLKERQHLYALVTTATSKVFFSLEQQRTRWFLRDTLRFHNQKKGQLRLESLPVTCSSPGERQPPGRVGGNRMCQCLDHTNASHLMSSQGHKAMLVSSIQKSIAGEQNNSSGANHNKMTHQWLHTLVPI